MNTSGADLRSIKYHGAYQARKGFLWSQKVPDKTVGYILGHYYLVRSREDKDADLGFHGLGPLPLQFSPCGHAEHMANFTSILPVSSFLHHDVVLVGCSISGGKMP